MKNTDEKEKPNLGKGNILVMDDEKIIREMMDQMLSRLGYNVAVARDGAEAVECYQKAKDCGKPYDIVILDLTVKEGIGGREAIRRLIEIDPNVKGIVTSGGFDDPGIKEYKEYGFKGIVMKPYSINELSKILNKMMMEY
jgi:CheY-like chemotaxis protein